MNFDLSTKYWELLAGGYLFKHRGGLRHRLNNLIKSTRFGDIKRNTEQIDRNKSGPKFITILKDEYFYFVKFRYTKS